MTMFTKTEGINIKVGNVLMWKNTLHLVTKKNHVRPGKGRSYVQLETKTLRNHLKSKLRLKSNEYVQRAQIKEEKHHLLCVINNEAVVIDSKSSRKINIPENTFGDKFKLLEDNMEVRIVLHGKELIIAKLPEKISVRIEHCEVAVKKQRFTSSNKMAFIKNNTMVMVPQFIKQGDFIIIKSSPIEYLNKDRIQINNSKIKKIT